MTVQDLVKNPVSEIWGLWVWWRVSTSLNHRVFVGIFDDSPGFGGKPGF
ncbi:hypothetical protein [Tychonema sp. BBK16]